jgi:hypothetical protein
MSEPILAALFCSVGMIVLLGTLGMILLALSRFARSLNEPEPLPRDRRIDY